MESERDVYWMDKRKVRDAVVAPSHALHSPKMSTHIEQKSAVTMEHGQDSWPITMRKVFTQSA